jgi:hypothetical protein
MKTVQDYKEDFVLFLELGFIAVNQMDADAAMKLFEASEIIDPKSSLPKVGRGYYHINKLELNHAANLFNEVLKEEPKNEMAKTFLGLTYALTPDQVAKGEKLLEEMAKSEDKMIKKLASSALEFVEKFVKKYPSPVESLD